MHRFERTLRAGAASALVAFLAVTVATAAAPTACGPDVEKFCQGAAAGAGHVLGCLEEHVRDLAPECRTALEGTMQRADQHHTARPAWVSPCRGDIDKLCKGAPAGASPIARCLAQHRADLSDACQAAFGTSGR